MSTLTFTVRGLPGAQGSKRHVGHGVMVESSAKVKPWRSDVKAAAEAALERVTDFGEWPARGPVAVAIEFRFARPKGHYRTGRYAHLLRADAPTFVVSRGCGDLDKIVRSTGDAMTAAGVFADDSLIAHLTASKTYCTPFETPGAFIVVTPFAHPTKETP